MEFADGTKRTNTYNACSSVVMYIDEAGNEFTNTYDSLSRRVAVSIAAVTGFDGTTAQTFQYDGAGRQTQTTDTRASGTQTTNTQYDSLGRVLEFAQTTSGDTLYMSNTGFTSLVNTQQQYPNGNKVDWAYDILYRKASVKDNGAGSNTAAWTYAGPGRVVEVVLKNGIACTMLNNTRTASVVQTMIPGSDNASNSLPMFGTAASDRLGYDGSGRMVAKRFIPAGLNGEGGYTSTTPVVGFTTSFDKAGNKYYERMLHAENRSHLYQPYPWNYNTSATASGNMTGDVGLFPPAYDPNASGIDSVNRLRQYQRGTLAGPVYGYLPTGALPGTPGSGGHAITTKIDLPNTDSFKNYSLDALGNWESSASIESEEEDPVLEKRNHNLLNQITRRKVGEEDWVDFVYDKNGNLRDDGERLMTYDALNRLIKVEKKMTSPTPPVLVAEYTYNAMTFRTLKTVTNGGLTGDVPNGTTRYLYNASWQVMEERSLNVSTWTPTKQNVWGQYIDELIQLKLLVATGPQSPQLPIGDYYPLQDLLYRTQALINSSGTIVEAYDYDAYGNTIIFKAPGTGGNWMASDALQASWGANNVLWCGYINSSESCFYYTRERYFLPRIANWISQDPILSESNNLYQYCGADPINFSDPSGLARNNVCGLDVTRHIWTILADVDRQVSILAQGKRGFQQLLRLLAGINTSAGWDITDLAYYKFKFNSSRCGLGSCKDTVQFQGLCVKPHELNYILYGYAAEKLHQGIRDSMAFIFKYRVRFVPYADFIYLTGGFALREQGTVGSKFETEGPSGRQSWAKFGHVIAQQKGITGSVISRELRARQSECENQCCQCPDKYTGSLNWFLGERAKIKNDAGDVLPRSKGALPSPYLEGYTT